jgi:Tfp pilus assembly protein FimT
MSKAIFVPLNTKSGFSLIEILISISFFSVLVFAGAAWINLLNRESLSSNESIAIANALAQTRYALGDTDLYCTKIVGRLPNNTERPFDTTNPQGVKIPSIDFYDPTLATNLGTVVKEGEPVDDRSTALTREIRLRPISVISSGANAIILGSLEFSFTKVAGPNDIVRKIPLYVTVQNGRIKRCSTSLATFMISNRLCEINNDGYQAYNPVTDECDLITDVDWFPGNDATRTATCPAGWFPAVSGLEMEPAMVACTSDSSAGMDMPPRDYRSGFVADDAMRGWSADYDAATKACRFVYIQGLTPVPGASKIKCAKQGVKR